MNPEDLDPYSDLLDRTPALPEAVPDYAPLLATAQQAKMSGLTRAEGK
jgi:hypothetical protein